MKVSTCFTRAVAIAVDTIGHRPEWSNLDGRAEILFTTREIEGLSQCDAALARRTDELAVLFGAGSCF